MADLNFTELVAIREALIMFDKFELKNSFALQAESGLSNAIARVNDKGAANWEYSYVINHIQALVLRNRSFTFHHILRESNGLADTLVKQGNSRICGLYGPDLMTCLMYFSQVMSNIEV